MLNKQQKLESKKNPWMQCSPPENYKISLLRTKRTLKGRGFFLFFFSPFARFVTYRICVKIGGRIWDIINSRILAIAKNSRVIKTLRLLGLVLIFSWPTGASTLVSFGFWLKKNRKTFTNDKLDNSHPLMSRKKSPQKKMEGWKISSDRYIYIVIVSFQGLENPIE